MQFSCNLQSSYRVFSNAFKRCHIIVWHDNCISLINCQTQIIAIERFSMFTVLSRIASSHWRLREKKLSNDDSNLIPTTFYISHALRRDKNNSEQFLGSWRRRWVNSDIWICFILFLQFLFAVVAAAVADVSHILDDSTTSYPPRPYAFSYEAGRYYGGHTDRNYY